MAPFDNESSNIISTAFSQLDAFLASYLDHKEQVAWTKDTKFWLGLVLATSALAHFMMKAVQRSPTKMGWTPLAGENMEDGGQDADPDKGGSEGARINRMLMFFGINLSFLSVMQCWGGSRMQILIGAVAAFTLITAPLRCSQRVHISRGREGGKASTHSVYHQFPGSFIDKVTRFISQSAMILFYVQYLGKVWHSGSSCYVYWLVSFVGIQTSSARSSQVGKPWNGILWRQIFSKDTACSCVMDFMINGFARDILRLTLPLLLMRSPSSFDLVKDLFAVVFITTIDDTDAETFEGQATESSAETAEGGASSKGFTAIAAQP